MQVKLNNSDLILLLPEGYHEVENGSSLYPKMYHARKARDTRMFQNVKSESYGNVVVSHIDSSDALPFGNKDALIKDIRRTLNDDQGLIEVETGTNPRGFEFIYSIIKTYHQDLLNVNYCLRMDIKNGDEIIEVLASYFETRMTGLRSSHGYALVMHAGFEMDEESVWVKGYAEDPYDPDYKKGCLMNLTEKRGLDGLFPHDPLSQARELVLALTEDSYYKTREEMEAEEKQEKSRKKPRRKTSEPADEGSQKDQPEDKQTMLRRLFSDDVVRNGAYKVDITDGGEPQDGDNANAQTPFALAKAAMRTADGFRAAVAKSSAIKTPYEIPDDYRNKLNQPIPKELPGWGKQAYIGFGKGTPFMSGICMSWPVSETESMPLNDFQDLISKFHADMDEHQGLVYAKCGLTPKGNRYACGIRKMRFPDNEGNLGPVNYELGFNIRLNGKIHFIDASFQSRDGMPGYREGTLDLMSRGSSELRLDVEHWARDPYVPDYKNGLLMEWTEDEKYDDLFPYDPLSEARSFIRYLVANN